VLFGGDDGDNAASPELYRGRHLNDTGLLTPPPRGARGAGPAAWAWARLAGAGGPGARAAHCAFAARGCLYLFGGVPGPTADLWRLCAPRAAGAGWEQLRPRGGAPPPPFQRGCRDVARQGRGGGG
jgi:hypothetical protein